MSLATERARPATSHWPLATLGLCALFVLAFTATHGLRPDLDPSWTPISEHAIGSQGAVMTVAFLALAAACGTLSMAWRRTLKGWQGVVARLGLILGFAGFALAAIFPADSVLVSPQATTVAGMVHGAGAILSDGVPVAALFAAWAMSRAGGVQGRHAGLMWLGAGISLSGFIAVVVLMATFMPANGQLGPEVPIGWAGRYMMGAHVVCREQRFYKTFSPEMSHGDMAILRGQQRLHAESVSSLSVADMAEWSGLEMRTFVRRFLAATGLRPHEYHQQLRIEKARELLETTTSSIANVASDVGYTDPVSFRRLFLKLTGLTPSDYRKRFGHAVSAVHQTNPVRRLAPA